MNPKYLYLSIDLISLSVPLAASFSARAPFYKKWKFLGVAMLITAIFFLLWDELFTQMGVWGFNPKYITGIYVGNLPLEEVLFFFCIPYACAFTYFAINHLVEKDYLFPHQELISSAIIILLLIFGIFHIDKIYTGVTFISLSLLLAYQMLKVRPRYMGRFYFMFAVILVPFFIVNGILTGSFTDEPVVWYNDAHMLGIRIGTVPFEDIFYGMLLLLLTIGIMEYLEEWAYWRSKK